MTKFRRIAIALALLAVILASMYVTRRNDMVTKRETIRAAWAQVNVVIERRADLIPNLVNTVEGYAAHEQTVFDSVTRAREALIAARTPQDRVAANSQLDGALGRLLMVAEAYPNLKANENFLELQDQLEGTENRIAVERRRYDEAVRAYNTYIGLFPNNLVASLAGFPRENDYFSAAPTAQAVPKVEFPPAQQ
jgi:LemA protein